MRTTTCPNPIQPTIQPTIHPTIHPTIQPTTEAAPHALGTLDAMSAVATPLDGFAPAAPPALSLAAARGVGHRFGDYAIQRMVGAKEVRRTIVKDKLNVVGENHAESGAKRHLEAELSTKKTGGGYWQEPAFEATEATEATEAQKPKRADPAGLRIVYLLSASRQTLDRINAVVMQYKGPRPVEIKQRRSAGVNQVLDKLIRDGNNKLYSRIDSELAKFKREEEEEIGADAIAQAEAQYNTAKTKYRSGQLGASLDEKIAWFEEYDSTLTQLHDTFVDMTGTRHRETGRVPLRAEAVKMRSAAMHKAANHRRDTPGIWKIGESHVQDIKTNNFGNINDFGDINNPHAPDSEASVVHYNLVTKSEFATDMFNFMSARQNKGKRQQQARQKRQKKRKRQKQAEPEERKQGGTGS